MSLVYPKNPILNIPDINSVLSSRKSVLNKLQLSSSANIQSFQERARVEPEYVNLEDAWPDKFRWVWSNVRYTIEAHSDINLPEVYDYFQKTFSHGPAQKVTVSLKVNPWETVVKNKDREERPEKTAHLNAILAEKQQYEVTGTPIPAKVYIRPRQQPSGKWVSRLYTKQAFSKGSYICPFGGRMNYKFGQGRLDARINNPDCDILFALLPRDELTQYYDILKPLNNVVIQTADDDKVYHVWIYWVTAFLKRAERPELANVKISLVKDRTLNTSNKYNNYWYLEATKNIEAHDELLLSPFEYYSDELQRPTLIYKKISKSKSGSSLNEEAPVSDVKKKPTPIANRTRNKQPLPPEPEPIPPKQPLSIAIPSGHRSEDKPILSTSKQAQKIAKPLSKSSEDEPVPSTSKQAQRVAKPVPQASEDEPVPSTSKQAHRVAKPSRQGSGDESVPTSERQAIAKRTRSKRKLERDASDPEQKLAVKKSVAKNDRLTILRTTRTVADSGTEKEEEQPASEGDSPVVDWELTDIPTPSSGEATDRDVLVSLPGSSGESGNGNAAASVPVSSGESSNRDILVPEPSVSISTLRQPTTSEEESKGRSTPSGFRTPSPNEDPLSNKPSPDQDNRPGPSRRGGPSSSPPPRPRKSSPINQADSPPPPVIQSVRGSFTPPTKHRPVTAAAVHQRTHENVSEPCTFPSRPPRPCSAPGGGYQIPQRAPGFYLRFDELQRPNVDSDSLPPLPPRQVPERSQDPRCMPLSRTYKGDTHKYQPTAFDKDLFNTLKPTFANARDRQFEWERFQSHLANAHERQKMMASKWHSLAPPNLPVCIPRSQRRASDPQHRSSTPPQGKLVNVFNAGLEHHGVRRMADNYLFHPVTAQDHLPWSAYNLREYNRQILEVRARRHVFPEHFMAFMDQMKALKQLWSEFDTKYCSLNAAVMGSNNFGLFSSSQQKDFDKIGVIIYESKVHKQPNEIDTIVGVSGWPKERKMLLQENIRRAMFRRRHMTNKLRDEEVRGLESDLKEIFGCTLVDRLVDPTMNEVVTYFNQRYEENLAKVTDRNGKGRTFVVIVFPSTYCGKLMLMRPDDRPNGDKRYNDVFVDLLVLLNDINGPRIGISQITEIEMFWSGDDGSGDPTTPDRIVNFGALFPTTLGNSAQLRQYLQMLELLRVTINDEVEMLDIPLKYVNIPKVMLKLLNAASNKNSVTLYPNDQPVVPTFVLCGDAGSFTVPINSADQVGNSNDGFKTTFAHHFVNPNDPDMMLHKGSANFESNALFKMLGAVTVSANHTVMDSRARKSAVLHWGVYVSKQKLLSTVVYALSTTVGDGLKFSLGGPVNQPVDVPYSTLLGNVRAERNGIKNLLVLAGHGFSTRASRAVHVANTNWKRIITSNAMKINMIQLCEPGSYIGEYKVSEKVRTAAKGKKRYQVKEKKYCCPLVPVFRKLRNVKGVQFANGGTSADAFLQIYNEIFNIVKTEFGNQDHPVIRWDGDNLEIDVKSGTYISVPTAYISASTLNSEPRAKRPEVICLDGESEDENVSLFSPRTYINDEQYEMRINYLRGFGNEIMFRLEGPEGDRRLRISVSQHITQTMDDILRHSSGNRIVFNRFGHVIRIVELHINVDKSEWLTGNMMMAYLKLLVERNQSNDRLPSVALFPPNLMDGGNFVLMQTNEPEELRETLYPLMEILSNENSIGVFPIREDLDHWTVAVYNRRENKCTHYRTLTNRNSDFSREKIDRILIEGNQMLPSNLRRHFVGFSQTRFEISTFPFIGTDNTFSNVLFAQNVEQILRGVNPQASPENGDSYITIMKFEFLTGTIIRRNH